MLARTGFRRAHSANVAQAITVASRQPGGAGRVLVRGRGRADRAGDFRGGVRHLRRDWLRFAAGHLGHERDHPHYLLQRNQGEGCGPRRGDVPGRHPAHARSADDSVLNRHRQSSAAAARHRIRGRHARGADPAAACGARAAGAVCE
jgi:hypothetical protein